MSKTVPDSRFRPLWSNRPIALLVIGVAVMLHAGVRLNVASQNDRAAAFRSWGLLEIQASAEQPELTGPFDLWTGEWWRVPLGGMHHGGWWHLAFACYAVFYLGGLLEPKLPKPVYALFLLGALLATTLPRWLGGDSVPVWFMGSDPAIGLSGVAYAQFACLLMLTRADSDLANRIGEGAILIGIAVGLGSLGFSLVIPSQRGLDNLAHLVGLPYGILWGLALSAQAVRRRILVAVLALAHLVLWPCYQGVIRPLENARYHWWLAENTEDASEKQSHYERALGLDPNLERIWLELAEIKLQTEGPQEAWRVLVLGMRKHPNTANLVKPLSEDIWAAFKTKEERRDAWQIVEREFPQREFPEDSLLHAAVSPQQMAEFLMERGEPLKAWEEMMLPLREHSLPPGHSLEDIAFAKRIWQALDPSERPKALAIMDQDPFLDQRACHLALIPNRDLIAHYQDQGELLWAWESLMKELRDDPTFRDEGKHIARQIWQALPTELRRERARNLVDDLFGKDRLWWHIELDILSEAARHRYRLDQSVELPIDEASGPSERILPIDPDDPESAALGVSL